MAAPRWQPDRAVAPSRGRTRLLATALLGLVAGGELGAREPLGVVGVRPAGRALAVAPESRIRVEFDRPLDPASLTAESFWAFGRWSGVVAGRLALSDGGRVATLTPDRRLSAGESVMVILSRALRAMDGGALAGGYSFTFWVRSRGAGLGFERYARLSTRSSPGVSTRAYGGFGSDLDGDGFLDLTIVNEDTDDLRVFLNRGDGSGRLRGFLPPTARTGPVPSPSEPSDFDRDGLVDVVVANTRGDTVSVFRGRGDGTFEPAVEVPVGGEPRGVTVLDADGDGDVDIAATSFATGAVTVLFNDGRGGFARAASFGTGGGERAIAAGDMNGDGRLDLVVGALTSREIQVYLAAGDGGFDLVSQQASGGEVWMLVLGDLDGDGAEDVATVNSADDNGAILLGDGGGGLAAPRMLPTDPFPLATDLADLDGDGDLDWVTSSFDGDWLLFRNEGGGDFARAASFPAPAAASCSLAMDLDNDGVVDLALIDEIADEVLLYRGDGTLFAADFESGATGGWSRIRGPLEIVAPGLGGSGFAVEVPVDGTRTPAFLESRHPRREASIELDFLVDLAGLGETGGPLELVRLSGGGTRAVLTVESEGRRYRARLWARDGGALREVGSTRVRGRGPVTLGIAWASATGRSFADGRAALTRNGRLRARAADLDNHAQTIGRVRLGLPAGSPGAETGSFVLDRYRSRR